MLPENLIAHFEVVLSKKITAHMPLSGGDINQVYLLQVDQEGYVAKINDKATFPGMFQKEAKGLQLLKAVDGVNVPDVIYEGNFGQFSFLLVTYIASVAPATNFWNLFAEQLARIHQQTNSLFGLSFDNYIGSLHQYNDWQSDPVIFFIEQRLFPQFELAQKKGYLFAGVATFYKNLENEIPQEPPSLIHGDLWSGNFIVNEVGASCLIDPAVCYGSREMDISMMQLFGGFDMQVFERYNEIFPLENKWEERIKIWQLYYILVHLNLFGQGYYLSAKKIVDSYS